MPSGRLQTLCRGLHRDPALHQDQLRRHDHVGSTICRRTATRFDDKRTPQQGKSDLADILARWQGRKAEANRTRTDQSFLVPKAEIAGNDYDLSINRYKEVEYEAVEYDPPR